MCHLALSRPVDYPAGNEPTGLAVLDIDGDGNLDLALTDKAAGQVLTFHGAGDGMLGKGGGAFSPALRYATGAHSNSLDVRDVNHDGIPDVAVSNWRDNSVGLLLGNGDGTLGLPAS